MRTLDCDSLVNKQLLGVALVLLFCFFPLTSVYAAEIDFNSILNSMKRHAEPLIRFVIATAYVIGIWFVFSGVAGLKKLGQSQSMMQQHSLAGPLVKLIVGVMLLYAPTAIDISTMTIWGYSASEVGNMMAYQPQMSDPFGPAKEGAIAIVRVVGYVSFVRGFVILSRAGEQGGQQGTFGKGFMHIIGGILAINIEGTIKIISNTLGFGSA